MNRDVCYKQVDVPMISAFSFCILDRIQEKYSLRDECLL